MFVKKKALTLFAAITKITMSRNYLSRQAIYGRGAMGTKMAVTFSVIFMAHLEKRLFTASLLKPFACKRFIDNIFFLWNIPMEEVSIFVNFANSVGSTPWSNLLVKSHPSPLFFSTPRYSKDIAFQLLYKFSIYQQPTSSALELFSIHTSHPATLIIRILIRKRLLSKEKHYTFYEPTHSRRILINTNGDFEQRERLFHGTRS